MNLLDTTNITKEYIDFIFGDALLFSDHRMRNNFKDILNGFILCNCFFEPSTRTSLSFESAMKKLGGEVITFNGQTSSLLKGESDLDTLKTLEQYSDIIVLRHSSKKLLYDYSKKCNIPIINGGNGGSEHPTQALLDLYTIKKYFFPESCKNYNLIKVLFVGDIKHSRTIHSLENLLKLYDNIVINYFPYPYCDRESDININSFDNISDYDVVYMTRLQKERFDKELNMDIKKYILTKNEVNTMKETSIILHPLPRNEELDSSVDYCKQAKYFEQMKNGLYVRQAILNYHLNQ